jgi:tRNA(Ile)-lysidine synthase
VSGAPGLALIGAALAPSPAPVTLRVAYSGGRDSHVLLHWLAGQRAALAPHRLLAVHVDHGLQADAARWADHCAAVCAALGVPLQTHRIDARPAAGQSPEAAARRARYAALAADMQDGDVLLTAHHQTDQAETVLLALLRGAGVAGVAAMPAQKRFGRGWLLRPLLTWPAERLARYAQEHGLDWVEDPSNRDARFDRNFLRTEVLPRLARRWPAATATLARHAAHAAEAQALLDDIASADGATTEQLTVMQLAALSPVRQRNLLRAWLHHHGAEAPSTARLDELLRQALTAAGDRLPCVAFGDHAVRVWRGRLYLTPEPLPPPPASCLWRIDTPLELPGIGRLSTEPVSGAGLKLALLGEPPTLEVRFRGAAGGKTLRKRLQELTVPPWQRERWPLLYRGDRLLQIAGRAPAPADRAAPGEAGVRIRFEPCPTRPETEPCAHKP